MDCTARGTARMPDVVAESRERSIRLLGSPERARPDVADAERDLAALRAAHPLSEVYDVVDELLVRPATDTGLILAVTDDAGRLVWVEGDRTAQRRAEEMAFVPGADWSEAHVGTSAPGTALASGGDVQVVGEEHFAPSVHAWSCSAVPIRDPGTRRVLGAVDLTGDAAAVSPHTLPLLRAAVAAIEGALANRGRAGASVGRRESRVHPSGPRLRLLGRDSALLEADDGRTLELSRRHSEILLLLAAHPTGLSGPELGVLLYADGARGVTLRAELTRLRAVLAGFDAPLGLLSQPYRLDRSLVTDAAEVVRAVDRGKHRQALRDYVGAPLPASEAPGVETIRERTRSTLRESVLGQGSADAVLAYLEVPGHEDDMQANREALRLLPMRSPKRAGIVARLESLGADAEGR
ncbi:GAF domain-containing protein [Pseudoclavibacter chungangensis]|uniref:GAF domain-containing protein n=1 Tax=Pseudoclavibacter chungangensis TaxID=587635 RepID=A0A7J5BU42_9MICO|nr:GAF domain-containing protein [Pseudoclavibacter chungangensis]KAB1657807.1 GAF domain-containing protein [Pseudoclavibacter chungangensis]NYJ66603.1 hypothetical protein [Pseudoclavibacter chungangensis]